MGGKDLFSQATAIWCEEAIQFLQIVNGQPYKLKWALHLLPRDQAIASINLVTPEPQKTPTTPFVNGLDHPLHYIFMMFSDSYVFLFSAVVAFAGSVVIWNKSWVVLLVWWRPVLRPLEPFSVYLASSVGEVMTVMFTEHYNFVAPVMKLGFIPLWKKYVFFFSTCVSEQTRCHISLFQHYELFFLELGKDH